MFPQLDRIVAMGEAETIIPGASSSYRLRVDNRELFYKVMMKHPWSILKNLERPLFSFFKNQHPQFRRINYFSSKHIEKENRTVEKWAAAGIPVIPVYNYDKDSIVYPFVQQENYVDYLNEHPGASIKELLVTMNATRALAYEHQDSDYFHSDPHLENFLYDEHNEVSIPIDPGIILRDDRSLESLDASNNLFFLYSFFRLDTPRKYITQHLEDAVESFEPEARKRLFEANNNPFVVMNNAYLMLREYAVSFVKGRPARSLIAVNNSHTGENQKLVNDIITS